MVNEIDQILAQSADRIRAGIANFLPGFLALLVVVLVALVIAWIARIMIRRSLKSVDFDRRLERWGFSSLAEYSPSRSPALLIAAAAFWCIVLMGLLLGLNALDASLTSVLVIRLFNYLPNVVAAMIILVLGSIFARFLARGVLISAVNMQIYSARLLSLGVKWLVMVLAGAMALEHLGIGGQIIRLFFGILFGGIVFALALAVGLGSKDIVTRSLERQAEKGEEEAAEHFHHL
jgi:hypothetical protein